MSRAKTVCLTFMDFLDGPLKFRVPEGYKRLQINQFTCCPNTNLFISPGPVSINQGGKVFKFTQREDIIKGMFKIQPGQLIPPPFASMSCTGLGAWRDIISTISFPTADVRAQGPQFSTTLTMEQGGVIDPITGAAVKFASIGKINDDGISFNYPETFIPVPKSFPVLRTAGFILEDYYGVIQPKDDEIEVAEFNAGVINPPPSFPSAEELSHIITSAIIAARVRPDSEGAGESFTGGGNGDTVITLDPEPGSDATEAERKMVERKITIAKPRVYRNVAQVGDALRFDPPYCPDIKTSANTRPAPGDPKGTRQVPFTSGAISCSNPSTILSTPNTVEGFTLGMQGNVYEITSRDLVFTPLVMNNLFFNNQTLVFQFTLL